MFETKYSQNSADTITTYYTYYNYKAAKYYTDPGYVRLQLQYDW